jgi:hypothetical protein
MKHIRRISAVRRADAYTDFLNGLWVLWQDFVFAKKNELTR